MIRIILFTVSGIWLFGLPSCNKDEKDPGDPDDTSNPQTIARAKLTSGTWMLSKANRDNIDVSADFTGFSIIFNNTGFAVENGGTAWSSLGTWSFDGQSADRIVIDAAIIATVLFSNNDQNLRITFTISETHYDLGRSNSLEGNYVFDLMK